ncbi:MAG: DnaD domain protein [Bacilli bacterium]
MNQYQEMLEKGIIGFERLLLETYYLLEITEVDVIILIKLNDYLKKRKNVLILNDIISTMSIKEETFSKRVAFLVSKGFVNLELDEDNNETFSLKGLYSRLAIILENGKDDSNKKTSDSEMYNIINTLEKESKTILSPIELEIVSKWFFEYKYSFDLIESMVLKALKDKRANVRYIDKLLAKSDKKIEKISGIENPNIQELFNKVYDK